eukprot:GHVS01048023.1.p1 GENE.GHVS01048023.1~~GHVS01048023.1.p1  ORF type:complete len:249 (+),score=19.05 GHVS01048023.1:162-908(+)
MSALLNPRVFMDVSVAGRNAGRLVLELFADELPITSENFRCLCTGETGLGYYLRPRWYKHTPFHRSIPNFMCQGGDFLRGDGFGSESIYGQFFRDEKVIYKHSKRGVLSMARTRIRHSNSCQFFITFAPCPWLDGKHVVFGQLLSGWDALSAIEAQGTERGTLRRPAEVFDCGELLSDTFEENVLRVDSNDAQPSALLTAASESELSGRTSEAIDIFGDTERPTRVSVPQDTDCFSIPDTLYKRSKFL